MPPERGEGSAAALKTRKPGDLPVAQPDTASRSKVMSAGFLPLFSQSAKFTFLFGQSCGQPQAGIGRSAPRIHDRSLDESGVSGQCGNPRQRVCVKVSGSDGQRPRPNGARYTAGTACLRVWSRVFHSDSDGCGPGLRRDLKSEAVSCWRHHFWRGGRFRDPYRDWRW